MKNRYKNIIWGAGAVLFLISIIGGIIFYFLHKDDGQETLYLSSQPYVNKNVYLKDYYDRKALDAILKDKKSVADVVRYFGKPSGVLDKREPDISGDFSGIFIYTYNPQTYDANKQKQCGTGFKIIFSNGLVHDWDIMDNGIKIPAMTNNEVHELLHYGMSMERVNELLGEPSIIVHDNQMISSYEYYFENSTSNDPIISLIAPLIIVFDSNGNISSIMVLYKQK